MKLKRVLASIIAAAMVIPTLVANVQADVVPENYIPLSTIIFKDSNFLKSLRQYDKNSDGYFSPEEIESITTLSIDSCGISSLEGIDVFTNLSTLLAYRNEIKEADLSKNLNISFIDFQYNQLTSIKLPKTDRVNTLDLSYNQLTEIDLSGLSGLTSVNLQNNLLYSLNVSNLNYLYKLEVSSPNLESINLTGTSSLSSLTVSSEKLTEVNVKDCPNLNDLYLKNCSISEIDVSKNSNLKTLALEGTNVSYVNISGCSKLINLYNTSEPYERTTSSGKPYYYYMEGINYLSMNTDTIVDVEPFHIDLTTENFKDKNFIICLNKFSKIRQGMLFQNELDSVKAIDCSDYNIQTLDGIQFFDNLEDLNCSDNNISEVTVTSKFKRLDISGNPISTIDISNNINMQTLLMKGDYSKKNGIVTYEYNGCLLRYSEPLVITGMPDGYICLDESNFADGGFRSYLANYLGVKVGCYIEADLLSNVVLVDLSGSSIEDLKGIELLPNLHTVDLSNCPILFSVDLSHNTKINRAILYGSGIEELILGNNDALNILKIEDCPITSLDISGCRIIKRLYLEIQPSMDQELLFYYHQKGSSIFSYSDLHEVITEAKEQGVAGFAERLYSCALNRKSDAKGKQDWIDALEAGTFNGAQAAQAFFFSQEFIESNVSNEEFINRLYATFMDRKPDKGGFDTWMDALNNQGWTREQVFMGFVDSQEWANVCFTYGIASGGAAVPDITIEPSKAIIAFATRLYTTCLCRAGEAEGIKNWSEFLANRKMTGTEAAYNFFFSNEFVAQNVSDDEFINRLYQTFMNRSADVEGYQTWSNAIKEGWTREQVFYGFAQSAEFANLCKNAGIKP